MKTDSNRRPERMQTSSRSSCYQWCGSVDGAPEVFQGRFLVALVVVTIAEVNGSRISVCVARKAKDFFVVGCCIAPPFVQWQFATGANWCDILMVRARAWDTFCWWRVGSKSLSDLCVQNRIIRIYWSTYVERKDSFLTILQNDIYWFFFP